MKCPQSLSVSSLDRDSVERNIIAILREKGIDTWYSNEKIETADECEKKIKDGLKTCDWFLVVMTAHSVRSKWVQREVFWATDKREGHIIPVMLETCDPEELNLALFPIQYIDFRLNIEEAQHHLCDHRRVEVQLHAEIGFSLDASSTLKTTGRSTVNRR